MRSAVEACHADDMLASCGARIARQERHHRRGERAQKSNSKQGQHFKGGEHGVAGAITNVPSESAINVRQDRGNHHSGRGGGQRATGCPNYGMPRSNKKDSMASRIPLPPYRNSLAKSQPAKLSPEQLQDILEETLADID